MTLESVLVSALLFTDLYDPQHYALTFEKYKAYLTVPGRRLAVADRRATSQKLTILGAVDPSI